MTSVGLEGGGGGGWREGGWRGGSVCASHRSLSPKGYGMQCVNFISYSYYLRPTLTSIVRAVKGTEFSLSQL